MADVTRNIAIAEAFHVSIAKEGFHLKLIIIQLLRITCSLLKGLAKRSQHFNAISCNIVGRYMLHTFGHRVAICCNMLDDVGSNLKTVKFSFNIFGFYMMLYSFGHVHATLLR